MSTRQDTFVDRLFHMARANGVSGETPIADLRHRYSAMFEAYGAPPRDAMFEPAQIGPLKGEWVRFAHSSPNRLIIYFHGGGYVAGSPQSHRALTARLALASESTVFALDYRLAPEFAFPAAVRDGIDVYRHITAKGVSASAIVLAGDGSGGGFAFSVLSAVRNAKLPMPAGCIAVSPVAYLSLSVWAVLQNAESHGP